MSEEKAKKKRLNSKAKGSGFENVVAKKLSAALDPLKFIRTQGSGARVGGKNFDTIGQMFGEDALKLFVGDVVPVNERQVLSDTSFRYSVETKFYKTPDSFTALVSGNANFFKWFDEACVDAEKVKREPCLIFKWNNTSIFVAVESGQRSICPRFSIRKSGKNIDVYDLEDVLNCRDFWIG